MLLWVIGSSQTYAQSKIAYIDFQYIISQLKSAEDVQVEIQKLASEWTAEIDAMTDTLNKLEKDIETVSLTLSKSGREILEKRISDRRQKITAFQEQKFSPVTGELYKKQQELLQPLIDKVRRSIDNVRLREKFDVVFDVSAGNPVSIDKKFDVTILVIDELSSVGLTVKQQAISTEGSTTLPAGQKAGRTDSQKQQTKGTEEKAKIQPSEKKDEKKIIDE
jgi:outer membrane protein